MAAKWQQWMPFHIDKFKSSPAVQAMHPTARSGYLYLLTYAWQTDDCTVPDNDEDLAEISGLGEELWAEYRKKILRKFAIVCDGKLRNEILFSEWKEAKRVYEKTHTAPSEVSSKRSDAGRKGNEIRWGDRKHIANESQLRLDTSQTDRKTSLTGTGTYTEVQVQEQKQIQKPLSPPSPGTGNFGESSPPPGNPVVRHRHPLRIAAKRRSGPRIPPKPEKAAPAPQEPAEPKPPTKTDLLKSRHAEFKAVLWAYWQSQNPNAEMPWDGREGGALDIMLRASPLLTPEQFRGYLANRCRSQDVNHAERPSTWIGNVIRYAAGPLDRYGKPLAPNGRAAIRPEDKLIYAN